MHRSEDIGTLYIVATPIGHLDDISYRAVNILSSVDIIAAEDTRHSAKLLHHYGIEVPCIALHEHNERQSTPNIIKKLLLGQSIALISDAGTPLISDPGYVLVKSAREQGIRVAPIPGASALIAALCASGMPCDRFCFEGFLPAKPAARRSALGVLQKEARTLVFYESPHRIESSLNDMVAIFGENRVAVLARELSKTYETFRQDRLKALCDWVKSDTNQQKGEIVVLVSGYQQPIIQAEDQHDELLKMLLSELSVKQSVQIASKLTGEKKNRLYARALLLESD